jgi:hypothetical protein
MLQYSPKSIAMKSTKPFPLPPTFRLTALAVFLCASCEVQAALMVYEGFNGYSPGANFANASSPNSNTVGLDKSTNFGGAAHSNLTYSTTGLTFGDLLTSGGSVQFGTTTSILSAKSALTSAFTGTLYSSFLVNFTSKGSSSSHGFLTRITDNNDNDTGGRINAFADSRSNSVNAAIAYGSAYGSPALNATTGLVEGSTYIVISSFENIGINLADSTGIGRLYALTLSQFTAMTASPNWESYLNNTTVGTGANEISVRVSRAATTGTVTLGADAEDFFQIVTTGNAGAFDELRYGSTLDAVIPLIPEPSSALLTAIGMLAVLKRRRR